MEKRKTGKNINCKVCNKVFYIHKCRIPYTKCCSKECALLTRKDLRPWRRTGNKINCKICGKEVYIPKCRIGKSTCCSKKCSIENMLKHNKKFSTWNKGLTKENDTRVKINHENRIKTCRKRGYINSIETRGKMSKSLKGREGHNKGKHWGFEIRKKISLSKSGDREFISFKSKLTKRIRMNKKYLEWRASVFKRDNYHCQNCGERGYLEAHHIIPFSKLIQDYRIKKLDEAIKCKALWDLGNGITYCRKCHILLDKNIGRGLIKARLQ